MLQLNMPTNSLHTLRRSISCPPKLYSAGTVCPLSLRKVSQKEKGKASTALFNEFNKKNQAIVPLSAESGEKKSQAKQRACSMPNLSTAATTVIAVNNKDDFFLRVMEYLNLQVDLNKHPGSRKDSGIVDLIILAKNINNPNIFSSFVDKYDGFSSLIDLHLAKTSAIKSDLWENRRISTQNEQNNFLFLLFLAELVKQLQGLSPLYEKKKILDDANKSFHDIQNSVSNIQEPFENIQMPLGDIKGSLDHIRSSCEDIQKYFDNIKMSFGNIQKSFDDILNLASTLPYMQPLTNLLAMLFKQLPMLADHDQPYALNHLFKFIENEKYTLIEKIHLLPALTQAVHASSEQILPQILGEKILNHLLRIFKLHVETVKNLPLEAAYAPCRLLMQLDNIIFNKFLAKDKLEIFTNFLEIIEKRLIQVSNTEMLALLFRRQLPYLSKYNQQKVCEHGFRIIEALSIEAVRAEASGYFFEVVWDSLSDEGREKGFQWFSLLIDTLSTELIKVEVLGRFFAKCDNRWSWESCLSPALAGCFRTIEKLPTEEVKVKMLKHVFDKFKDLPFDDKRHMVACRIVAFKSYLEIVKTLWTQAKLEMLKHLFGNFQCLLLRGWDPDISAIFKDCLGVVETLPTDSVKEVLRVSIFGDGALFLWRKDSPRTNRDGAVTPFRYCLAFIEKLSDEVMKAEMLKYLFRKIENLDCYRRAAGLQSCLEIVNTLPTETVKAETLQCLFQETKHLLDDPCLAEALNHGFMVIDTLSIDTAKAQVQMLKCLVARTKDLRKRDRVEVVKHGFKVIKRLPIHAVKTEMLKYLSKEIKYLPIKDRITMYLRFILNSITNWIATYSFVIVNRLFH